VSLQVGGGWFLGLFLGRKVSMMATYIKELGEMDHSPSSESRRENGPATAAIIWLVS